MTRRHRAGRDEWRSPGSLECSGKSAGRGMLEVDQVAIDRS